MHELEEDLWIIIELDIHVEEDMTVLGQHQQIKQLDKRADPLSRQLGGCDGAAK